MRPRRPHSASTFIVGIPILGLLATICAASCLAMAFGGQAAACAPAGVAVDGGRVDGVPSKLVSIYQGAAAKYRLGPRGPSILASINWNESSFGTNMGDPPGAYGWMSFLPESWASFGVDGDGDGRKDAYDPDDAIFAAARLLRYLGAPGDWHGAIFGYNHAEWYVEDVLGDAEKWSAIGSTESTIGCTPAPPTGAVAAMVAEADRLSAMRPQTEYVWGGSHGISPTPMDGPFDCSSAVSHLLQVGGLGNETLTTVGFRTWGEPGPGKWITILNKPFEPEAHVVLRFDPSVTPRDERFWGTSGFVEPGHGPGWIPESVFDAGYLARFEARHPIGL